MEAIGQNTGFIVIQIKGCTNGGIGCLSSVLGRVGVSELIDRHRDSAYIGGRPQGTGQIAAVGEQIPVVLPTLWGIQIDAAPLLAFQQTSAPFKRSGIGAQIQIGFHLAPVHSQHRKLQAVQ